MATGADIIATQLYQAGCRHAFGIPGGEVLDLIDALDRVGIEFHLAKHENAAGFMAEGVWHATGAPAILVATIGPGVANCVNVVANAHQDRVPMIIISGRVDTAEAETYTHQVFDHQALMRPITKASLCAVQGAVQVVIAKALTIALAGQPGPVHIDLPISVAAGQEKQQQEKAHQSAHIVHELQSQPVATTRFEQARNFVKSAKRILVIAGVDAVNQGAGEAIAAFCHQTGAGLITTYKGKGLLDEKHPQCLGGAGLSPLADIVLLPLIAKADVIILAGYDPIEMRANWRNPWSASTAVVEFSAVLPTHFMHSATFNFTGDIAGGLNALLANMEVKQTWLDGELAKAKADLLALFAARDAWGPATVFHAIRQLAPRNTIATADSGAHRILLSQIWQCHVPRGLLQSSALCTMGCALPLAIGYQMAARDIPVIAFMGDAGCEMVLGELATARDQNVPIIIVVLVDESLALIELKQRAMQHKRVGVRFGATDFVGVAQAMGGHGAWVQNKAELEQAIKDALNRRDTFTLIAARISEHAYEGLI